MNCFFDWGLITSKLASGMLDGISPLLLTLLMMSVSSLRNDPATVYFYMIDIKLVPMFADLLRSTADSLID